MAKNNNQQHLDSNDTLAAGLSVERLAPKNGKGEKDGGRNEWWSASKILRKLWVGKGNTVPRIPHLHFLPPELLERIFILASNPRLAMVNRRFYHISSSPLVRADWVLYRYGAGDALARCWRWNFMRSTLSQADYAAKNAHVDQHGPIHVKHHKRGCLCTVKILAADGLEMAANTEANLNNAQTPKLNKFSSTSPLSFFRRWWHLGKLLSRDVVDTANTFMAPRLDERDLANHPWMKSKCEMERSQCFLTLHLIEIGAEVSAGGNMALRFAASQGHLFLVELLLRNGADPDATVPIPSGSLQRWMARNHRVGGGGVVADAVNHPHPPPLNTNLPTTEQIFNAVGLQMNVPLHQAQQPPLPFNPNINAIPLLPPTQPPQPPTIGPQAAAQLPINNVNNPPNPPIQHGLPADFIDLLQLHPFATLRNRNQHGLKITLLMQAVHANHIPLARILVKPHQIERKKRSASPIRQPPQNQTGNQQGNNDVAKISRRTLQMALREAFRTSKIEMCRLLIEEGGATTTLDMVHELVARAGTWRLTLGIREKLTPFLVLALTNLPQADFNHIAASVTRSSAEIGSPAVVRACLQRGADVNIWDGLPLYASVYNGNLEVTKFLLNDGGADTAFFGWRQRTFCTGLIFIEGFAILMFSLLVGMWAVGMGQWIELGIERGKSEGSSFTEAESEGSATTSTRSTTTDTIGMSYLDRYSTASRGSPPSVRANFQTEKLDDELALHIKKALSPDETAPKQKHVRACIMYTWDVKGPGSVWTGLRSFPLLGDEVVTFKALITIHKIINGGHSRALQDVAQDHVWIETIGRQFQNRSTTGYGALIKTYTQFLVAKLDYHRLHPEFSGSFDYQEYITLKGVEDPNEGFETISELLGLLERIQSFSDKVLGDFRPGMANECRIAGLVPLIEESKGIYDFLTNMLMAMHRIIGSVEVLAPLRERFNMCHYALLKFYTECSSIHYLTSLVDIPRLSKSPPDFLAAGPPSLPPRSAPRPPKQDSDSDLLAKQQAEIEAQIKAENARIRAEKERKEAEMERQRREQAEQQRAMDLQRQQMEQQRALELQKQLEEQRKAEEERQRQLQMQLQQQHNLAAQQQAQQQLALEQQALTNRYYEAQSMIQNLQAQANRDRNTIDDYNRKMQMLEQQLSAMSLAPRDDDLVRRLQEELAQWKQKYEALAKLYAQLRKEHLELLNKFRDIKGNSGKMADEVRKDLDKARDDLVAKQDTIDDLRRRLDLATSDAQKAKTTSDAEVEDLRRRLDSALQDMMKSRSNQSEEAEFLKRQLEQSAADLQRARTASRDELEDLRRRLEQASADLQRERSSKGEETMILQQGLDQTLMALSQLQKTQQETEASLLDQLNQLQQDHMEQLNRMMDNILQSCIIRVDEALYELESPAHEGNQTASPEYVQTLLEKTISHCTDMGASFVRLIQGGDQADAISTSNTFALSISQLLHNAKGVTRLAKEDEAAEEIIRTVREGSLNGRVFFDRLKSVALASVEPSRRADHINELTRSSVIGLLGLNPLLEKLAPKASLENLGGDLGDAVEREMQAAARAIEEAARRLEELMARPGDDLHVNSAILKSAMALTNAIQQLIRCATACQQEIVSHGRGGSTVNAFYKKNNKWTEGLVSAAKAVAVATTHLVECADGLVKGTHSMEQLIVAAQEVDVATTQLVAASRVKAVAFSKVQDKLEDAAVAVRQATKLLVKAARDAAKLKSESQAREEIGRMGRHEMKIKEMEQQVKILELEKALNQARYKLGEIRKQGYADAE
ncbi:sla2 Src-like adaptor 2 [Phlyctochytrium planicorne]|nr:sla2 Src-like adaptor 2 [Phlyctochytrium planicorne]